jgi:coenzyme PQQ synthesis protein D (PqqD)
MGAITLSDESRIVVSKDQVSCDLAGEAAILNLRNGVYYGLDPVGARIWNLVQQPTTFNAIRDALLDDYDVEKVRLEADIKELLDKLAEHGLIDITP